MRLKNLDKGDVHPCFLVVWGSVLFILVVFYVFVFFLCPLPVSCVPNVIS